MYVNRFTNLAIIAGNRPNSEIPQCICPISHNTTIRKGMCTFLFWMVHCGIWDMCIAGFERLVYCEICGVCLLFVHLCFFYGEGCKGFIRLFYAISLTVWYTVDDIPGKLPQIRFCVSGSKEIASIMEALSDIRKGDLICSENKDCLYLFWACVH